MYVPEQEQEQECSPDYTYSIYLIDNPNGFIMSSQETIFFIINGAMFS